MQDFMKEIEKRRKGYDTNTTNSLLIPLGCDFSWDVSS
jgi:hypothetical protein